MRRKVIGRNRGDCCILIKTVKPKWKFRFKRPGSTSASLIAYYPERVNPLPLWLSARTA
jgi:hypothetical protein